VQLKEVMKKQIRHTVGESAKKWNFRGGPFSWKRKNDLDDWALANIQASKWNTSDDLQYIIEVGVLPLPWMEFRAWQREHDKLPNPNIADALFRYRLQPSDTGDNLEQWWSVSNADEALTVAEDMTNQLETLGWPVIASLLDRTTLIKQVQTGDFGNIFRKKSPASISEINALLLSDYGLSDELDTLLAELSRLTRPDMKERQEQVAKWILNRARSRN
jgi:hypothetical protein